MTRRNHKLKASDDDDFTIRTQQELSTMLNSTTDLMTTLLACIAGISLVVYQYLQGTTCGCKGLFHKDKDSFLFVSDCLNRI